MNILQRMIAWLYFKFAFKRDELGHHIVTYYLPGMMKNVIGGSNGAYLFGQINKQNGKIEPIAEVFWGYHLKDKDDIIRVNLTGKIDE